MLLIITDVAQDAGVGAAKSGNVSGDPLSPCLRLLPLPRLSQSLLKIKLTSPAHLVYNIRPSPVVKIKMRMSSDNILT